MGAACWTVIRSEGRTRPTRGRVKGPTTARVEPYGSPVQSVAGEGEGLNRGQPGVRQHVTVNPPSVSRQKPKTFVSSLVVITMTYERKRKHALSLSGKGDYVPTKLV